MACCTGIAQGPMVRLKLDPIEFAEFSKAIGLMPRITPTHSCDGAQLRKRKRRFSRSYSWLMKP